jgi:selenide,water dikinase
VQVLSGLPIPTSPDVLLGPEGYDDAGVFRIAPDVGLVQTVDFFPPVVDDARWYGRIAAANSLSDVYAKGGVPLTVLQIVGFPKDDVPLTVLREILEGAAETVREAGAVVLGGHSVKDTEIKFGLAVTGRIDPAKIVPNSGAKPGDAIYLTKPLGMGAITTAIKKGKVSEAAITAACETMARLNKDASEAMLAAGVHAATDITGFGFLGHSASVARQSKATFEFEAKALPLFPGALALVEKGILSGGSARTREFLGPEVAFGPGVGKPLQDLIFDAETSGGLLIVLPPDCAPTLESELERRNVPVHRIGRVLPRDGGGVLVRVV